MNIILCGFKGCGKSTIGAALAKKMHYRFDDTDTLLEEYYRKEHNDILGAAEIYSKHGNESFRELETQIILKLEKLDNRVIALGGGTPLNPVNVAHLRTIGTLIYLRASKELLRHRMLTHRTPGFLDTLNPTASFEKMYKERYTIYETIANRIIDVDGKTVEQNVEEIIYGQ